MPHSSFVPRKPEPIGCEIKSLADGESGVLLFLEIEEGKDAMSRKQYYAEVIPTLIFDLVGVFSLSAALPQWRR